MRRFLVLSWSLTLALSAPTGRAAGPILGFEPESTSRQTTLESKFDSLIRTDNLRDWMKRLSARPHHLGSPYGKENADFIASLFRSWGYDTKIEEFQVLFPTPKKRLLEVLEPEPFIASLAEPALAEDASSSNLSEALPLYNAYSIDGEVTGEVVYVNYGVPKDYEELEARGIDVKGKIVIARYGGSWRGIKPKVAAEHGAVGCLIYSDPRDDGYFNGDAYPLGAYRNESSGQRGSVADMPMYPGDPLTPGVGATKDAVRLDRKDAPTLTKIPVLPISWKDALPILRSLTGPVAPEAWRGALPITYHLGPGATKVHLQVAFDWKLVPAYNVIARMQGSERPDEWILRGNHHDAWVFGADDPISGMVALLEEARAVGELRKGGWKPKRSIVYAAWDGEEPGLLGSTEWVEAHADELTRKAAVYINTDGNGRGFLSVGGSHTLEKFVGEVARDVTDPQLGVSVRDRARARKMVNAKPAELKELRERSDLRIDALGSGSDFTPFIQHLGVASIALGFEGENDGGSYHSIYDSFEHYSRFGDPGFAYGATLAKTAGRMVLRLANAEVLPFEFTNFSETIGRYVEQVKKLADEMREETVERNRRIAENTFVLAADPNDTLVVAPRRPPVPHLNFTSLENAADRLEERAEAYKRAWEARRTAGSPLSVEQQRRLDLILLQSERALTRAEGLPGRPWFKHQIYAPGQYTGYGVKTLPAVREAIEQRKWGESERQAVVVASTLDRFIAAIDRAIEIVRVKSE